MALNIIDPSNPEIIPEPEPIRDWVLAELTVAELDLIEACLNACKDQIAQVPAGPQLAEKIKATFRFELEHLAHVAARQLNQHGEN